MSGVEARAMVEAAVRRELFGPLPAEEPQGKPLDCSDLVIHFGTKEESYGRFYDRETGQEVLTSGDPLHRYGVGVLYPGASLATSGSKSDPTSGGTFDAGTPIPGLSSHEDDPLEPPPILSGSLHDDIADSDDFDLTDANKFKPSAMAVSFKCRTTGTLGGLRLVVSGAYYDKLAVYLPAYTKPFDWWVRRPFDLEGVVDSATILTDRRLVTVAVTPATDNRTPRITPSIQVFTRPVPGESDQSFKLLTVSAKNATLGSGADNALFQMRFSVEAVGDTTIEPYPEEGQGVRDQEEQSLDLLYRKRLTYAIGHGCAATWNDHETVVSSVVAEPMPVYEVPSLTPDVFVQSESGTKESVTVSMRDLALGSPEGDRQVELVLGLYEQWIKERQQEADGLAQAYQPAANRHLDRCRDALVRMRAGWAKVVANPGSVAARAFRWTNEAMLYQQLRSSTLGLRPVRRRKDDTLEVVGDHPVLAPLETIVVPPERGNWRPFQIAFILATLPEIVDRSDPHRSIVDLIFFPTGGGKTEAYLGASALSLLARRLRDPNDAGTDTLMRYTLRLLTTQQFQRAASLVCVLEDIRSRNADVLGENRFGIGVWLGGTSTPNRWTQAIAALNEMERHFNAQNKFLLLRCPWCGAQMGPQKRPNSKSGIDVVGYQKVGKKVILRCVDPKCRFSGRGGLPVHVVDEDIYDARPSIIIGTVDKFAMLAWVPKAHTLFGLGADGKRQFSPPGLIIQDELHLISGPLGSMVGIYEPIINDLCTDKRRSAPTVPKIIASTATARRYEDQILSLFGRGEGQVTIFPPHGLEEGRSFFAEPQETEDDAQAPGRRYLGVFSASLGSMQTVQVRVAASTLQVARDIPEEDRDGYWTNLNFLNSLRELGNTVSLLQSDVPDYLTGLRRRDGLTDPRWPRNPMELTSRRRNDEIPKAIEQLQVPFTDPQCVDICLASNIIEVGIDIDRLGLMTIIGQPKTTAQYIQVSGRVGRQPSVSPGLVITIYGAAKPRDRSHFERFQTYHQRLYAQVEPTSVTPFAQPVLRRALHAAIVAGIRQSSNESLEPNPFPGAEFDAAALLLQERAAATDFGTVSDVSDEIRRRKQQWRSWQRTNWSANAFDGDPEQGLMRFAGTLPALNPQATIWDVPTSMRNVDAECSLQISLAYAQEDGAQAEGGDE